MEIINRCNFRNNHIIHARLSSQQSLVKEDIPGQTNTERQQDINAEVETKKKNISLNENRTYSTMLKLISGTLVGWTNYCDVYTTSDMGDTYSTRATAGENDVTVPTLQEVARKVAHLEKTKLDEKQYIAYEMIACTFLLSLVMDGNDSSTTLFTSLQKTVGGNPSTQTIKDIMDKLRARGGQEQLLMFLTGPAGSGKSTAVRVAEQFCYEFCIAVGIMWSDTTFLFTAYTGAAASLIGGTTISRTAYLNQKRAICDDDIKEWKDVRILVIDEVSFMGDGTLQMLNKKLTNIGQTNKSFGGFTIIFIGDFRQMEPICSKETDLMFSTLSSMEWRQKINAIIILDNDHRFKEDPEYGRMLKRMWEGDLDVEDRKRINTRVIGYDGLELPSMLKGEYIFLVHNTYQNIRIMNNLSYLHRTLMNTSFI